MEETRRERNHDDEQVMIRRMKDECDQALAKQWKIANEQLTLVILVLDTCLMSIKHSFRQ